MDISSTLFLQIVRENVMKIAKTKNSSNIDGNIILMDRFPTITDQNNTLHTNEKKKEFLTTLYRREKKGS